MTSLRRGALALALISAPLVARGDALVGQPAPGFTLVDSHGQEHSLESYRGRFVVLEWVNYECPFVGKHYGSGHMQQLQEAWTGKGVIWLAVSSAARGKQGHYAPAKINALAAERNAHHTAYLMDESGEVGRAYGAKTTPHMFVIDPDGVVIYAGGIDDRPSTDLADIEGATNYVDAALEEAFAGRPVSHPHAVPYGCNIKY